MNIPRNVEPNENHIWGALPSYSESPPNKQTNKNNGYGSTMASSNISALNNYFIFKFNVKNNNNNSK